MDMFTLHVEHAVLLGLFTILTLINCRLHDAASGAYWFPAYTSCAFLGAVLIALRGHHVSDAASVVFGTAFFHIAYLCLHRGLDFFFENKTYARWPLALHAAALVVAIAGLIQYGSIHPDTARRVIFYSVLFAFQTTLIAVVLVRNASGPLALSGRLMAGLLGLIAFNNIIRAYLVIRDGAPANYVQGGLGLQLSLLETTVLQCGIVVAFVWMTAAVLHDQLDTLASTDSLTGLKNRRALELAAEQAILLSRKHHTPLTAILIDLDRFKQINDVHGHSFGDHVLLETARCLQDHMRQSDLLARVGGDEFAVLLYETDSRGALEIAERLRSALEALIVTDRGAEAHVRASFGLAEADSSVSTWNELVRKCDKAVYAGKEVGGNLALVG